MKYYHIILFFGLALATSCAGKGNKNLPADADTIVSLNNSVAAVSFSKWGGAMVNFHLRNDSINPFTWSLKKEDMPENNQNGAPFRGHFLCTGRWGGPTPGEIRAGIPHNGEPSNSWWLLNKRTAQSLRMVSIAKLEGFEVERSVFLNSREPVFEVTEVFTNKLNIARNLPIVQHATLAAPFLTRL